MSSFRQPDSNNADEEDFISNNSQVMNTMGSKNNYTNSQGRQQNRENNNNYQRYSNGNRKIESFGRNQNRSCRNRFNHFNNNSNNNNSCNNNNNYNPNYSKQRYNNHRQLNQQNDTFKFSYNSKVNNNNYKNNKLYPVNNIRYSKILPDSFVITFDCNQKNRKYKSCFKYEILVINESVKARNKSIVTEKQFLKFRCNPMYQTIYSVKVTVIPTSTRKDIISSSPAFGSKVVSPQGNLKDKKNAFDFRTINDIDKMSLFRAFENMVTSQKATHLSEVLSLAANHSEDNPKIIKIVWKANPQNNNYDFFYKIKIQDLNDESKKKETFEQKKGVTYWKYTSESEYETTYRITVKVISNNSTFVKHSSGNWIRYYFTRFRKNVN